MENTVKSLPGSFIEEKESALVWHYDGVKQSDSAPPLQAALAAALQQALSGDDVQIVPGRKSLEVRPGSIHKGLAAQRWLQIDTWDFILAAGDDATDEDMFKALPAGAITIKVGDGESIAQERVSGPDACVALLRSLSIN